MPIEENKATTYCFDEEGTNTGKVFDELLAPNYIGHLASDETLRIANDHDPKPLRYQFEAEYKGQYEWEDEQEGPKDWVVKIRKIPS